MEVRKMEVKIYGPGCPRCGATETNVRRALKDLKMEAEIDHIYDIPEFAKAGIKITPGVVVDGKLIFHGVIPTVEEATEFFSTYKKS